MGEDNTESRRHAAQGVALIMKKQIATSRHLPRPPKGKIKLRKGERAETSKHPRRMRGYQEEILAIQSALYSIFRSASPRSKARDLGWISADLAGLWEVSIRHERDIRRLLKCSYPRDRSTIEKLMTEILVNLLSDGLSHLTTLKKLFPPLRELIYGRKR